MCGDFLQITSDLLQKTSKWIYLDIWIYIYIYLDIWKYLFTSLLAPTAPLQGYSRVST